MSNPAASSQPPLHFVMQLVVEIGVPLELGENRGFTRRIVPITGGTFTGPRLTGVVLDGGADWQHVRPDGVAVLDARYTLRTHQGEFISLFNRGFRHGSNDLAAQIASGRHVPPSAYYFMTAPLFETTVPSLQWLTRSIFLGQAQRESDRVLITVWQAGNEPQIKPSRRIMMERSR